MDNALPLLDEQVIGGQANPDQAEAGFGALRTERGVLPLEALEVRARLLGLVGHVEVTQTFVNVHAEPLEATYIFPLPDRAAVTGFRLEVAGRVIEGDLQERGAARQEYDRAIQAGHRAAIAEEERPGVFTLRVGNLPAGERARVRLQLVGPLPYRDGEVEFRFPLVVAPRYIPGSPLPGPSAGDGVAADTDAVPDASRISPPVLLPGFPNPVRLGLSVEVVSSSMAARDFRSSLHTLVESESSTGRRFRVQPGERLNRDLVLRYRLAGEGVLTSLALEPDANGEEGTWLLTLVPPAGIAGNGQPRDVVFVLDRSGSMGGWKMVTARRAVARMVETLTERDRFAVYAFDDAVEPMPGSPGLSLLSATNRRRFQAAEWLGKVEARGGTEMAGPLDSAVREVLKEASPSRQRLVVLITDGQVGNEDQILRTLGENLRQVRVFALGIDQAVNAGFLRRLADAGGGACELVESEARLEEVMDSVQRHLGTPVLTGLKMEPAGLGVVAESVTPGRLPDLFAGRPVTIAGRYRGKPSGAIVVRGKTAEGGTWATEAGGERAVAGGERAVRGSPDPAPAPAVRGSPDPAPGRVLAPVWARGRVRDLEDRFASRAGNPGELEKEIVATSLRFGVLCRFTAYVAVDRAAVVNEGGRGHQIVQPVEQPAGWEDATMGGSLLQRCLSVPAVCASPAASLRDEAPGVRAPKKTMLAKQVLSEINEGGRVSKKTPLACDDVAREKADAAPRRARRAEEEEAPSDRSSGGLLETAGRWLRSILPGGGKGEEKKDQAPKPTVPPPLDREPFRDRAEKLLARMETPGDDMALLRAALPDLEQFVKELEAAGDVDSAVGQLRELVKDGQRWLATSPDAARAIALRQQAGAALRAWLALLPGGAPPPVRANFWK